MAGTTGELLRSSRVALYKGGRFLTPLERLRLIQDGVPAISHTRFAPLAASPSERGKLPPCISERLICDTSSDVEKAPSTSTLLIKAKDGEKIGDKVTVGVRARYDVYDLYTDSRVLYSSYESFYLTAIIPGQYRGLDCRERLVADLAKDKFDLTIKKHYTGVTDSDIEAILDIDPKAISVITPPSGIRETSQRYAYKSTHFLLADDTAYHPAGERPIKCVQSMPESAFVGFVIGCVHREGISDSIDYGLTVSDSSRPLLVEAPDMTDVAADLKKHLEWLRGQVDWCYARWWQGIDGASGEKLVGRIKALEKILDDAKEAAKRLE